MTSISPWSYAATQVATARQLMDRASRAAADGDPAPFTATRVGDIARPEVEAPEAIGTPFARAQALALQGLDALQGARSVGSSLAPEVLTALDIAAAQATSGLGLLGSADTGLLAPGAVSARFHSSSLWLGLAGSLLQLNHDTRWPVDRPLLPARPAHAAR